MIEYVWRTVGKTVPPRTSVPLPYLSSIRGWNFRLQRCSALQGDAYGNDRSTTDGHRHTHYRVCRRFDHEPLSHPLPFLCCDLLFAFPCPFIVHFPPVLFLFPSPSIPLSLSWLTGLRFSQCYNCRLSTVLSLVFTGQKTQPTVWINCLPYNLYCVGGDVKHCSLTIHNAFSVVQKRHRWTCSMYCRPYVCLQRLCVL